MRLIDKDKLMEILCQHCDSHIEMCEDCGMREIIESVPSAWISVKDRLPEESGTYLVCDVPYMIMSFVAYRARWERFNCYDTFTEEYVNEQGVYEVTHWMPLPDAPEVGG